MKNREQKGDTIRPILTGSAAVLRIVLREKKRIRETSFKPIFIIQLRNLDPGDN